MCCDCVRSRARETAGTLLAPALVLRALVRGLLGPPTQTYASMPGRSVPPTGANPGDCAWNPCAGRQL